MRTTHCGVKLFTILKAHGILGPSGFYLYMGKDQRLVAGFLVFIGVTALVLGFVQTRQGINVGLGRPASSASSLSLDGRGQANGTFEGEDPALKAKDTDKDGLDDYSELRVYRTSPYIADSDGDAVPDGEEVKKGTDPNCPQGKKCAAQEPVVQGPTDLFGELRPPGTTASGNNSAGSFLQEISAKAQIGQIPSPAELRRLLGQSGQIAPDLLAKISDQELIQTWQSSVGNSAVNASASQGGQVSLPGSQATDIPSPADMRVFLKSQGMSEQLLNSFSDEQLAKMLQEKLKQTSVSP